MNRKTLIIIGVVLALVLIIGLLLLFLGRGAGEGGGSFFGNLPIIGGGSGGGAPPPPPEPTPTPTPEPPPAGPRRLLQIIDKDVLAPALSADGKSILYILRENGHIRSVNLDGDEEKELVSISVPGVFDAVWSPRRDRVAIRHFEDGAVKHFLAGVASTTTSRPLPNDITAIDWSPDGRLGYLRPGVGETTVVTADGANQRPAIVWRTPIPDYTIHWLTASSLLLASRPSGLAPSLLHRLALGNRTTASVLTAGVHGITVTSLSDGSFLYSPTTEQGRPTELTLRKPDGGEQGLGIMTLADKCGGSGDARMIYCGVPRNMIDVPMPDLWYQGAVTLEDTIVAFHRASNTNEILLTDEIKVDVDTIFATPDARYVFFHDKPSGTVWRIDRSLPR